jgi:trans-2,3-dihydro-3-hydroxyanthranilate isomerase
MVRRLSDGRQRPEVGMPAYPYVTVGVFTDKRFSGNPLAVFPDARGLSDADMQAIATEFNLSETTFVLPPDNPQHHARVRIFTPKYELPFAGHPNVGTGYVLARRDANPPEHYVFEELAGLVRVHVLRDETGQVCGARISAPRALSIDIAIPTELVASCIGLPESAILTTAHDPLVASVGTPFVIAELASVEALGRASPSIAGFREAAERFPTLAERFSLHLYVRVDGDATRLRARMFAPLGGVTEDPATGSANAALAALLTSLAPGENVDLHYEIDQGVEMGRPSRILASARKTAEGPVLATVAGNCVPMMQGTLEV